MRFSRWVAVALWLATIAHGRTEAEGVEQQGLIAFSSGHGGNPDIHLMDQDGRIWAQLTDDGLPHGFPSWSPDGQRLVYVTFLNDTTWCIDVMNADGSGKQRLTNSPGERHYFPRWSPDGGSLLFGSKKGDSGEVWVMARDGTGQRRIDGARGAGATWSPSGTLIAFYGPDLDSADIWAMDADGGNLHELFASDASDVTPAWSPDGRRIACSSRRDGNLELYVLELDSGNLRRLTFNAHDDWSPRWSGDGRKLVFAGDIAGDWGVWTMSAEGGEERQLTSFPGHENQPDWQQLPVIPMPATK